MAKTDVNQIIDTVEEFYKKMPPLPKKWNEAIVSITPIIALVFGVIGILVAIAALGVTSMLSPLIAIGAGVGVATNGIVGSLLYLIASALLLAAYSGTKAKKIGGWNFLFYSEAVTIISSLIAFNLGGVIGNLIAFYVLFQIKPYYK
ncbi:MAG TPA: hypothetical protein VG965_00275 [Patescibacteria group bacterium]|nr:hypothetical protein [Patescibacteria group bacterium]